MNDKWMETERALLNHASSLGDLLEQIRSQISPTLINCENWKPLIKRARELPVTMAAFPFGFELPLHVSDPRADLGVSLVSGSKTAVTFEEWERAENSDSSFAGLVQLLKHKADEGAPLRRITGGKMLLEYDVGSVPVSANPKPGFFLYPIDSALAGGDKKRVPDLRTVLDATVSAAGWRPIEPEHRHVERIYRLMTPDLRILSIGAFPSRPRAIRVALTGFETANSLTNFLERADWSGSLETVNGTVARLEKRDSFTRAAIHFDVREDGIGGKLGVSLYCQPNATLQALRSGGYWLDRPHYWTAVLDEFREHGFAQPEKLDALSGWPSKPRVLIGSGGGVLLIRGIHHAKLVIDGDKLCQAKAYVFMLMCAGWSAA